MRDLFDTTHSIWVSWKNWRPICFIWWSNVKPKDLANWYDEAFNKYIDVDNKEIEENRYEWMLNNLSERIGVCITKIKVLEDK